MEPKKRSVGASERDEWLRAASLAGDGRQRGRHRCTTTGGVLVEEMGTNTSLAPLYGWSRRGGRAHLKAPRNWGANLTLLASITREGMGPCLAVEGATTREVFEAYLEHVLAPSLRPGQVVVMDNLTAHTRVAGSQGPLIEGRGCELLYLPPYSPDLNPIEQAFSLRSRGCSGACRGAYPPRDPDRGDGPSTLGSHGSRHAWVRRPLWLPQGRPTAMTDAVA